MKLYSNLTDPAVIKLLREGAIGVIPGDTVYGVMGRADKPDTAARLYEVKARENKPGTVIAADIGQLVDLGLKKRYLTAVSQYWPGAVSVIIPCGPELAHLHLGLHSVAVRIPDDAQLRELLRQTGPLLTSSANLTGRPTAANIQQAKEYFGDAVDFYIDGGELADRQPSTLIRIIDDAVEVLRAGAVKLDS